MLDFQRYQLAFTAHIRNPALHPKPEKVREKRMAVYRDAVFNNIFESVSVCFPVCQTVIGKRQWRKLVRDFVANHAANSPFFKDIPAQFLDFLQTAEGLPAYFKALAHYEWVELALSTQPVSNPTLSIQSNLLHEKPVLALAHMLLEYDNAVHKISKKKLPKNIEKAYLFVFRNAAFEIKFIELNPVTFQLLQLIKEHKMTGEQTLIRLAEVIKHPNTDAVITFGAEILTDLANQQAIIGSICVNKQRSKNQKNQPF